MATPIRIGGREGAAGKGIILCRAATTAALATNTLSGIKLTATANAALASQDGVALAVGDVLLVKNEAEGKKNGPYKVLSLGSAGSKYELERITDFDTSEEARQGTLFRVWQGTQYEAVTFALLTTGAITLGTTALTFGYAGEWTKPTFSSGWEEAYSPEFGPVRYRKDANNIVWLRGLVRHKTTPGNATVIYTLPAGMRPSGELPFVCVGGPVIGGLGTTGVARVDVKTNGEVIFWSWWVTAAGVIESTDWVSLDEIHFHAD